MLKQIICWLKTKKEYKRNELLKDKLLAYLEDEARSIEKFIESNLNDPWVLNRMDFYRGKHCKILEIKLDITEGKVKCLED
jgi:hypothetical protein